MADELIFKNPNNGKFQVITQTLLPSLILSGNGRRGLPQVDEHMLQISMSNPLNAQTILSKRLAEHVYQDAVYGGEYIPAHALNGLETLLSADIAIDAVSMVVESAVTNVRGIAENIFVANRPYLLMNRKPDEGENIFETGVVDGVLKPAAEIIFVGGAYSSGTTVPIVRSDPNAAARKRFAVIQALPSLLPSYGPTANKGLLVELERPSAVVMGVQVDGGSQTINARFLASSQQANVMRADGGDYDGSYGVVTHYGVYCVKKAGAFKYSVSGVPEHCPPSQFDDGGQVDAVVEVDSSYLSTVDVDGTDYLQVSGINRYWDPEDCALKALTAGDYWVSVRAMNQAEFDGGLRISHAQFVSITVA